MAWLDKLAERAGYLSAEKAKRLQAQAVFAMLAEDSGQLEANYAQLDNQQRAYVQSAITFFCVNQKAKTAASYEFGVYERKKGEEGLEAIPNHPFEMLLAAPNSDMSLNRYLLMLGTFAYLSINGNAYWYMEFKAGEPIKLLPLSPGKISVIPDKAKFIAGYKYRVGGRVLTLESWEVVHIKTFNPRDPYYGLSDIEAHAFALEGDIHSAKEFNASLRNRGVPRAIVSTATPMAAPTFERFKADWQREYSGYENTDKTAILNAGQIEYTPLAIPPRDLQRLEARTFNMEVIELVHGVPLGLYARNATEANAIAAERRFLRDTIKPMHTLVQEALSTQVVIPFYGDEYVGQFDDCVLEDQEQRLRELEIVSNGVMGTSGTKRPVMTPDEIRKRYFQLDPLPEEAEPEPAQPVPPQLQEPRQQGPEPEAPDEEADEEARGQAKAADLSKWRKVAIKAVKAGRDPAERKFYSEWLTTEELDDIQGKLAYCETAEEVRALFADPFAQAGKATRRRKRYPDRYDERLKVERRVELALRKALSAQEERVVNVIRMTQEAPSTEFWREELGTLKAPGRMWQAISAVITPVVLKAAEQALDDTEAYLYGSKAIDQDKLTFTATEDGAPGDIGFGLDWALINSDAADWAAKYTGELVKSVDANTKRMLKRQVSEWINAGESLEQLIKRISPPFDKKRARRIAVTETTRAYAEANSYIWQKSGVVEGRQWQTAADERVCPICGPLHGQTVTLGKAFEGGLTNPPAHPNCILPGNEVMAIGPISAAAKSFYVGRAVEVSLASGRNLTVTENHSILTPQGWIAAKFLNKGDNIFYAARPEGIAARIEPDNEHVPAAVEQVFRALEESGTVTSVRMPATAEDFYGDGRFLDGNVNIVHADGLLLGDVQAKRSEIASKGDLNGNSADEFSLVGKSALAQGFAGNSAPASGIVRRCEQCGSLLGRSIGPAGIHGIRDSARRDTSLENALAESPAIDPGLAREFLLSFASDVALQEIVEIRYFDAACHVYDLQCDLYGLYTCNGVLVKNCRCWIVPVIPEEMPEPGEPDKLASTRQWVRENITVPIEPPPAGLSPDKLEQWNATMDPVQFSVIDDSEVIERFAREVHAVMQEYDLPLLNELSDKGRLVGGVAELWTEDSGRLGGIRLNADFWRKLQRQNLTLDQWMKDASKSGFLIGESVEDLARHEAMHWASHRAAKFQGPYKKDMIRAAWEEARAAKNFPSDYASQNMSEYFAEMALGVHKYGIAAMAHNDRMSKILWELFG